jgi:hypothetical protein
MMLIVIGCGVFLGSITTVLIMIALEDQQFNICNECGRYIDDASDDSK